MPETTPNNESPLGQKPRNTTWQARSGLHGIDHWIARWEKGILRVGSFYPTRSAAEAAARKANEEEL